MARPAARGRAHARPVAATTTFSSTAPSTTTSATSGTSAPCSCRGVGTVRGSCCASTRPRTGPRCGSTTRWWPSTRAGTPPSRRTSALVRSGRTAPAHRGRQQRADVAVAPARHRRGHARRPAAPAPVPRFLQLRRAQPECLAVLDTAVAHRGRSRSSPSSTTGRDRALSHHVVAAERMWRSGRAPRRRGRGRGPCAGRAGRAAGDRCLALATRPRLPLRAASRPHSTRTAWSTATCSPSASGPSASTGQRFLINEEPFYFRGSASTRTSTCTVVATTMRRWCTTSRSSGGSGPTRSGRRTTPTPRRSSTWPTASASSSSTRRRPSASTSGVGGGLFLGGPKTTFSEETIGAATQAVHQQAIEELIDRDKNHPCVVLWSLANEPESHTDEAWDYFEPLFAAARAADPTGPSASST